MHKTDFVWYDESVHAAILSLSEEYSNAIPVFSGALSAVRYVNCDHPNFDKFTSMLYDVAESAEFYNWHEGALGAVYTFCHLCYVDPALLEMYIGADLCDLFA